MNFLTNTDRKAESGGLRGHLAIHRDWILLVTLAVVIGVDQLTKFLVRENMTIGQSIPAEGFFRLTYHTNSGTIFGLFPNATLVLTVISVLAIAFLIYFYRSQRALGPLTRLAIGLLLGGAFGNLIDRLAMGRVTDFVDVGRWPIFNVADASITVGIFVLILFMTFTPARDRKASRERDPDGSLASGSGDRAD